MNQKQTIHKNKKQKTKQNKTKKKTNKQNKKINKNKNKKKVFFYSKAFNGPNHFISHQPLIFSILTTPTNVNRLLGLSQTEISSKLPLPTAVLSNPFSAR